MSTHETFAEPTLEHRARRRVALKKGFYIHLLVYILVNAGLYLLWSWGMGPDDWGTGHMRFRGVPLLGWGLGLAIHGIVVFVKLQGEGMTRRMVEREIEALKRREGP